MNISIDHLSLPKTAQSGQCFRFNQISENCFETVCRDHYVKITSAPEGFDFDCDEETFNSVWRSYFDLDTDYNYIEKLIMDFNDEHLCDCYRLGEGIRILRQDLWEIIVSFLISQNNNIKRIKNSIELICKKAAVPTIENPNVFLFPRPEDIDEEFFNDNSLGLGYRVSYLREIYRFARCNPEEIEKLKSLDYNDAYNSLLTHLGIGPKVANCICLFGLHHTQAFPIDTHVKQLLNKYYDGSFDTAFFENHAGTVQQFLFYYELNN